MLQSRPNGNAWTTRTHSNTQGWTTDVALTQPNERATMYIWCSVKHELMGSRAHMRTASGDV